MQQGEYTTYQVRDVHIEVPGVTTLSLTDEDGRVPIFTPGQYITVYFPDLNTPEGKAYSISSAPGEEMFSITVRAIGEFSHRLCALQAGDTVSGSLPYGFFYPEFEDSNLVLLAAGIGVAPFRSMLCTAAVETPRRSIALFHSVRTLTDAMFRDEFMRLKKRFPSLSLQYFVTREDVFLDAMTIPRRMTARDVVAVVSRDANMEFLICGSIGFTRDMWRGLRDEDVSEDSIYTEAFFSH